MTEADFAVVVAQANSVVASWPEWKRGLFEQYDKPTRSTPRPFVDNFKENNMTQQEAIAKVRKLLADKFGGHFESMFMYYSRGMDGIDAKGISEIMDDAGIHPFFRQQWINAIIAKVDKDGDQVLSEAELQEAIRNEE